ncbi:hypothetical protein T492DRAFT_34567 [Pavlovales sp. CCMP2436]|nr:hypothetical protein T492DRAFT_34567 [Pavlovales sp. CCMP2436]
MGDAAAAAAASRDLDDAIVREPPTVDKIRESFEGARLAARGFRRRVLLPMRVTGAVLGILGILVSAGVRGYGYGMLFAISGSAMLLFSLLPTDYRAIQCTAYLSITTMLAAALISSLYAASVAAELVSANAAGECTDNNCPFVIVLFVGAALAAICCLGLAGQLVFVLGRPRACRLHRLFKSMSKFYFVIGAELFAALVLCELAPAKYAQRLLPQLATQQYGLACAFCAAVATGLLLRCPRCRARMQSWLVQHDEAISAAAGIAALFDNRSSREVQERAAVTFRFITLDMLSEADLLPGVPGSDLFARSRQATFGGVDAFVSHSWHDDPAQKWAALREWGDAFVLAHGREPRLWVDRACCDQSAIGEAIRCLPLYLAGCSTLLVLQGENTLRRLWCVVEVRNIHTTHTTHTYTTHNTHTHTHTHTRCSSHASLLAPDCPPVRLPRCHILSPAVTSRQSQSACCYLPPASYVGIFFLFFGRVYVNLLPIYIIFLINSSTSSSRWEAT